MASGAEEPLLGSSEFGVGDIAPVVHGRQLPQLFAHHDAGADQSAAKGILLLLGYLLPLVVPVPLVLVTVAVWLGWILLVIGIILSKGLFRFGLTLRAQRRIGASIA